MVAELVVASTNPVKIDAVRKAFGQLFAEHKFNVEGLDVPSCVSDQPISHLETYQGALNRARNAAKARPNATYAIGIEGGIAIADNDEMMVFAWVVVIHRDGRLGKAQTGVFFLPQEVSQLIRAGYELGHADDIIFGRQNSKQHNGSIGLLTNDLITRTDYYVPAVIMAFIPFKNPHLTWLS